MRPPDGMLQVCPKSARSGNRASRVPESCLAVCQSLACSCMRIESSNSCAKISTSMREASERSPLLRRRSSRPGGRLSAAPGAALRAALVDRVADHGAVEEQRRGEDAALDHGQVGLGQAGCARAGRVGVARGGPAVSAAGPVCCPLGIRRPAPGSPKAGHRASLHSHAALPAPHVARWWRCS
jgi:hypothetical protein